MLKCVLSLWVASVCVLGFANNNNDIVKLGSLWIIKDAPAAMPMKLFIASAKELAKSYSDTEAPSSINCFLLRHNGKNILIDTGYGPPRGKTQTLLANEKIDIVLLTHMHPDHVGGLVTADGKAAFPGAEVYLSRKEYNYWKSAPEAELQNQIFGLYNINLFDPDQEILPGIYALDAAGHTPGHTIYENNVYMFAGDLLHATVWQLPDPEVSCAYDMDPEKAAETRRKFLQRAAKTGKTVAGCHFPMPAVGKIINGENGGFELK